MALLKQLEGADTGDQVPLTDILDQLPFNAQGLLPAIAQEYTTRDVLMLAWMDREAIQRTLNDGYATYFSRSRNAYWRKGETSGHVQRLVEMRFDCDGDTILLQVEQTGAACHTQRPHCFYLKVIDQHVTIEPNYSE